MLDQNQPQSTPSGSNAPSDASRPSGSVPPTQRFDMSKSFEGAAKFIPVRSTPAAAQSAPLSVSAPKSAAVATPTPAQQIATRLGELLTRAEAALPKLESTLAEEHAANARAEKVATDIEERLRLGVRMLQAFEVQSDRGERVASRAVAAIEEVERILKDAVEQSHAALQREAERVVREKVSLIAGDLEAHRERFRQFEASAEQLAHEKLSRALAEIDAHRERLAQAEAVSETAANERVGRLVHMLESEHERLKKAEIDAELTMAERIGRLSHAIDAEAARFDSTLRERTGAEVRRLEELSAAADARLRSVEHATDAAASAHAARLSDATAHIDALIARASTAGADLERHATTLIDEQRARLERELAWRFDRVAEVEARIEQAANTALVAVDAALGDRLTRIDEAIARADVASQRVDAALSQAGDASVMIERSERAMGALAGLSAESQRMIDSLAARVGDAAALREVLGSLVHELAAAREVVHGDMRRMRDDLGWLVEKSERLAGELVERADGAATAGQTLRAATDSALPILEELRGWSPLLSEPPREMLRPLTEAIAGGVRTELAREMQGFSKSLRQLATSADATFKSVTIETDLLRPVSTHGDAVSHGGSDTRREQGDTRREHGDTRREHANTRDEDLARSFARELARMAPISTFNSETPVVVFHARGLSAPSRDPDAGSTEVPPATPPLIASNRPLELDAS